MKRILALAMLFGVLTYGGTAKAMTVFDPTNLAENIVSAQEAVKQTAQMIEQYKTQLLQYERMLKDALSLPNFVTGDLKQQIQELMNFGNNISGVLSKALGGGGWKLDDVTKEFYAPSDFASNTSLFANRDSLGSLGQSEMLGYELAKGYADETMTIMQKQSESGDDFNTRFSDVLSAGQNAEGQMQVLQAQLAMQSLILERLGQIHQLLFASTGMQAAQNEAAVQKEMRERIIGAIVAGESEFFKGQISDTPREYLIFE